MDRSTVVSNMLWRYAERFGAQLIAFIVTVILGRILVPEDYGLIALVTVIIAVLNVFVDSGLNTALIQKKDADDTDFTSVFCFNIAVCLALYIAIFLAAPFIAGFYGQAQLVPIVRVLGVTLVFSGVRGIQEAFIARNMLFKRYFLSTLSGTFVSGVLGIGLALGGFGPWALVVQQVANAAISTTVLWFTVGWRPEGSFSPIRLRSLLGYSWKILAASLVSAVFDNLRQFIIGKRYTLSDLGFYTKGEQFPNVLIVNINTAVNGVIFPMFSSMQDDVQGLRQAARKAVKMSAYLIAPLCVGLAATAPQLVQLLLTEKWMPCVPYLRIFCAAYFFLPLSGINQNLVKAMGDSGLFLKLEIAKKLIGIALVLATMRVGVWAMCLSYLGFMMASYLIDTMPCRRLIGYGFASQLRDMLPSIAIALVMGAVVRMVPAAGLPLLPTLLLQIAVGMLVYACASALLRFEGFAFLVDFIRNGLTRP